MLEIAGITNPTGNVYIPTGLVAATLSNKRGKGESAGYQILSDETGKKIGCATPEWPASIRDTFPYRLLAGTTGADIYECRTLLIFIGTEIASHESITNTSFIIHEVSQPRKRLAKPVSIDSSHEWSSLRKKLEIADLASSMRQASGLDVESLAQIFNVSRVTYHRWLRGLPVRKGHRDYMLEILPLIEEAARRLGSPEAVSTWLLTPLSAGGKKPIEYLAARDYDLFRGFLLHQPIGKERFRLLKPSGRAFKPRRPEEAEDVREQIRPHTWYEDDSDLNSNDD